MVNTLAHLCLAVIFTVNLAGTPAHGDGPERKNSRPAVEVVFCLDTTGSMSGLIEAARRKIWAISNQIASGNPAPRLKIGLVAYRDRRDQYITKVTDLTDDLDAVYAQLLSFQAWGGGDTPESVNKALLDAVNRIKWSADKSTLKLLFLVGDAPPHMDYVETKYPKICRMAVKKNIIINSVQCGSCAKTQRFWNDICRKAEGSYVQIDANGGPVVVIDTPFDDALADINAQLAKSTLVFGGAKEQREANAKVMTWAVPSTILAAPPPMMPNPRFAAPPPPFGAALPSGGLRFAPAYVSPMTRWAPSIAADRASFCASTGCVASYDLLDSIKAGKVKLEDLKKEELPKELQGLSLRQQMGYLEKLSKRRAKILKKAAALGKQRNAFIARKLAEDARSGGRDSFDNQVLRILQRQARRKGIDYPNAEEKRR